jgi:hypothetical protein
MAFVSMLKLASHWMPPRRYATVSAIALFIGVMGATFAGVPLRALVVAFGWRDVMIASAAATGLVAAAIWIVVRDDPAARGYASYYPEETAHESAGSMLSYLRETLSYRNAWLMFLVPGAFACVGLTFAGLWGVPFLVTVRGFSTGEAAATASAMLIAWSLSGIVYAQWSERMGRRKPILLGGLVATVILWTVIVFVPALPGSLLVALIIAVGLASGAVMLAFAFAKESVPLALGGTVSGITNMGMMLGGMVMQPVVGIVLDAKWRGALVDGARIYDAEAYRWGFAVMLAWAAAGILLVTLTRETYCRPLR